MRIAYLSADYGIPVLGGKGGSVHIQSLVRAFARAGHDVALYCSRLGDGDVGSIPARLIEVAKPAEVSGTRGTSEREISQVSERLSKERAKSAQLIKGDKSHLNKNYGQFFSMKNKEYFYYGSKYRNVITEIYS